MGGKAPNWARNRSATVGLTLAKVIIVLPQGGRNWAYCLLLNLPQVSDYIVRQSDLEGHITLWLIKRWVVQIRSEGNMGKKGERSTKTSTKSVPRMNKLNLFLLKKVTKCSIQLDRVYLSLLDVTASCFKFSMQPPVNNYTWRYLLKQLYTPVSMQKPMYITERWRPPGRVPETRFVGQEMLGFRMLPI